MLIPHIVLMYHLPLCKMLIRFKSYNRLREFLLIELLLVVYRYRLKALRYDKKRQKSV